MSLITHGVLYVASAFNPNSHGFRCRIQRGGFPESELAAGFAGCCVRGFQCHLCQPAYSSRASITLGKVSRAVSRAGAAAGVPSAHRSADLPLRGILSRFRGRNSPGFPVDSQRGCINAGSPVQMWPVCPRRLPIVCKEEPPVSAGGCALRAVQAREPSGNNQWVHAPALSRGELARDLCELVFHKK